MKHLSFFIMVACFSFQFGSINAQESSPENIDFPELDASPMNMATYRNSDEEVVARVIYSRSQKKKRELYGNLVPHGQVWRTGANESTEITLYKNF